MNENMNGRMKLIWRPSCLFHSLGEFPSAVYAKWRQVTPLPASTPSHPPLGHCSMTFRIRAQPSAKRQYLFHVVPVGDDAVFYRVLQGQDASFALCFITHVAVFLSHSYHHSLKGFNTFRVSISPNWLLMTVQSQWVKLLGDQFLFWYQEQYVESYDHCVLKQHPWVDWK